METLHRCRPYLRQFARLYALYLLVGLLLTSMFSCQSHYLIGLVVLAMAAGRTALAFTADHRRPPSSAEKTMLVAGSFVIAWLIELACILGALVLIAALFGTLDLFDTLLHSNRDDPPFLIVLMATVLHVVILAVIYGPYAVVRDRKSREV